MNRKHKLLKLSQESSEEVTSTYSGMMRELNKDGDTDKVKKFMKAFKDAFDESFNEVLEDHQSVALLKAKQEIDA